MYKDKTYNGWNVIGGRSAMGKVLNGFWVPLQTFRGEVCNGGGGGLQYNTGMPQLSEMLNGNLS